MGLEWQQIVTQILGFLIALWLLRRFAWKGLLEFMEKRRRAIASSFEEIENKRNEVEAQKSKYEQELENIEAARRTRIQEAALEAGKLAAAIKEEARRETVALREKAQQDIALELDKANALLRDKMVDAVIASTEKVINQELDRDKHKKLIGDFLDEFQVKR